MSLKNRLFEGAEIARMYARCRPRVPASLVAELVSLIDDDKSDRGLTADVGSGKDGGNVSAAVDVGCGSGQNTAALAPHFAAVLGVDVSANQIAAANHANDNGNVRYFVGDERLSGVAAASAGLVTAAQSAHWFEDIAAFYAAAYRVLRQVNKQTMFKESLALASHNMGCNITAVNKTGRFVPVVVLVRGVLGQFQRPI